MKRIFLFLCLVILCSFTISCKKSQDNKVYTITFVSEAQTANVIKTGTKGTQVSVDAASKEGYDFDGWYNGESKVEMPYTIEDKDLTLTAKYTIKTFTVTFKNDDGSTINTQKVNYGDKPTEPNTPTKKDDQKASYLFKAWDKEIDKTYSDTTYTATYNETLKQYTYKFVSDDESTTYKVETVDYGTTIVAPANPTKKSTAQYSYTFDKWDTEFSTITADITIKAIFTQTTNQYTYKFVSDDGKTVYKEVKADYGTEIIAPDDPTKTATKEYTYTFNKWNQTFTILTKNITIKAVFTAVKNQYTYTFYAENGTTVLKQEKVDYGTVPTEPDTPTKESDETYNYVFNGWGKEVKAITDDTTYTATFKAVKKQTKYTTIENLKFSVLGDSISTFYVSGSTYNSYYTTSGTYYYPTYCKTIDTWEKTWWGTLMNNTKMQLGINNSWSGSRAGGGYSNSGCTDARMNTLDDNGTPDILLVYLGTNDCAGAEATSEFSSAIQTIIDKAKALGINQIYLTTLGYSAYTGSSYKDSTRLEYNKELRALATKNGCGIVPLDDYITDESYSFYLNDNLHYNPKGAALLAEIFEKSILEYNGLTYTKTINVEKKEKLPEGVLGKVTATASSGFWTGTNYMSNVYFFSSTSEGATNPTFSLRIELSKSTENNKYYVTKITKSGGTVTYSGEYVLCISSAHNDYTSLLADLENVVVGSIVEFDETMNFPMTITFKTGDGGSAGTGEGEQGDSKPVIDENGIIHVSNYNKNVFANYETEIFIYSTESAGLGGNSFMNFYGIGLVKDGDNYKIVSMKNVGDKYESTADVNGATYILLIYSSNAAKPFYDNASVGKYVKVTGDIESGDCTLELVK